MSKTLSLASIALMLLLTSCANIYQSPDAEMLASRHETVAIMPPQVTIIPRKKDNNPDMIAELEIKESENIQSEIYSWMLRRKGQRGLDINLQDVETTTAKLAKAGYFEYGDLTPKEICEILEVDALLNAKFTMEKPVSEGAAVALGVLFGFGASTNRIEANMNLFDKATSKTIWNYDRRIDGGFGSSPSQLVNELMRNASRRNPYFK